MGNKFCFKIIKQLPEHFCQQCTRMVKNFDGKAYQNCVYTAFKKKIKSSLGGAPKNVNASSGIVFPLGPIYQSPYKASHTSIILNVKHVNM